jgi:hypothetical protein
MSLTHYRTDFRRFDLYDYLIDYDTLTSQTVGRDTRHLEAQLSAKPVWDALASTTINGEENSGNGKLYMVTCLAIEVSHVLGCFTFVKLEYPHGYSDGS